MNIGLAAVIGLVAAVLAVLVNLLDWLLPNPLQSKIGRSVAIVVIFLVGYSAMTFFVPNPWNKDEDKVAESVEITSPEDHSTHPSRIAVSGNASGLGQGKAIWVANSPIDDQNWYFAPRPCTIRQTGRWDCPDMQVGSRDDTATFEIIAVVVDGDAQVELIDRVIEATRTEKAVTMQGIPSGATRVDTVTITRKKD